MLLGTGTIGAARWAVTDRRDGDSAGTYDSLNLGDHVGDDPRTVAGNRCRVADRLGVAPGDLRFARQTHGTDVATVARAVAAPPPTADALVTEDRGVALAVLVADCVPVLLGDRAGAAAAVAHAGRRGVLAGVVTRVVAALGRLGAEPARLVARVGPAICGRCYEVPQRLQDELGEALPEARSVTIAGTPGLDLPAAVVAQLRGSGVETVEIDPRCTAERDDLYSFRRDATTGRFAGIVWLP